MARIHWLLIGLLPSVAFADPEVYIFGGPVTSIKNETADGNIRYVIETNGIKLTNESASHKGKFTLNPKNALFDGCLKLAALSLAIPDSGSNFLAKIQPTQNGSKYDLINCELQKGSGVPINRHGKVVTELIITN